jgi:hypothetical protein
MQRRTRRLGCELLEARRLLSMTTLAEAVPAVRVEIPDQTVALPVSQFTVPVNIGPALGLRGAELQLQYDTTVLDADEASVTAGSVWSPDAAQVVANVDDATGTIIVWIFQADEIDAQAGSLVNIQFRVSAPVTSGSTTLIDLASARLNEDQIAADPAPQPGEDGTDGRITFFVRPTVSIQDVQQTEGNSGQTPFVFQVNLSAASPEEIRVDYATSDGTATVADNDYTAAAGTLVFLPGETAKTVTVLVTGDTRVEPDEQFSLQLQNLRNVQAGRTSAAGMIINDDESEPAGRGSLAGMVYADTNINHRPDAAEGMPGVKILLYSGNGTLLKETFTDHQGWYEFQDLPNGDYRIQQRQPAALIDGGNNERSASLTAGEQLVDLHFRELGLKPQYVFNRLLSASVQPPASPSWTALVAKVEATAQVDAGNTTDPSPPAVAQQIERQGTLLLVRGSSGDDVFRFDAGTTTHAVILNGQTQTFSAGEVTSVRFIGGRGTDTAELNGAAAEDRAELSTKFALLASSNYTVTAESIEQGVVRSTGADSRAQLTDSPLEDHLWAERDFARLESPLSTLEVIGFRRVTASSQHGGPDRLTLLEPLDYVLERTGSWLLD